MPVFDFISEKILVPECLVVEETSGTEICIQCRQIITGKKVSTRIDGAEYPSHYPLCPIAPERV